MQFLINEYISARLIYHLLIVVPVMGSLIYVKYQQ